MEWLILLIIIIGILAYLFSNLQPQQEYPYERQDLLFSAAERSFYSVLQQAVAENAVVFGKVRIADVIKPEKGLNRSNWQKAFNKISAKHFDYVLCQPDDLSVIAVIELDDKSHKQRKRAKRDQFIQGACAASGLMLHKFKARKHYNITQIRETIFPPPEPQSELMTPAAINVETLVKETNGTEQKSLCPKCSLEL